MRRHRLTALAGLALVLTVMFIVVPPVLAGGTYGHAVFDNSRLVDATRGSFVEFWTSGAGSPPPALQSAVDYWARYHALKAAIAALLAIVLFTLSARIRRTPGRTAAGAAVGGLALFAVLLVMANVQGVIAPLSSLLSLLSPDQRGGNFAATVQQIHQKLIASSPRRTPVLDTIVADFAHYHAALAVMACLAAAGLAFAGWRSRRNGSSGVAAAALAALMLVLCVANVSNAVAPEQGLLNFYR